MDQNDPWLAAGVREGEILAGKYRVDRILGVGGMGVVVAARHLQLDEQVALKFMLPAALDNAEAVARFAREARAAVRIKSEHVARVTDVGTLPNGAPYMVMEYLEGGDLAGWLKQRGPMPVEQAVDFVLQACVAVADAHAIGIVHRDLKPANLFYVRRSDGQLTIKVLDFGISKVSDGAGAGVAMTRTSALMGSPLYMSPEQMRSSRDVDALTDIWALGVIVFELVAGRPPFLAETVTELAIQVSTEPAPSIRTFRPDVPGALEEVVFKCLEKDRRRRYRNVAELAVALLPFAPRSRASVDRISGILQGQAPAPAATGAPSPSEIGSTLLAPGTMGPVGRTTSGKTGRRTALGASLLGVVAVVGLVSALVFLRRPVATSGAAASLPSAVSVDPPKTAPPPPPPAVVALPVDPPVSSSIASVGHAIPVVSVPPPAPPPRPLPVRPPPVVVPPPATAKPNCNPPYVIDSAGDRQYKPECL